MSVHIFKGISAKVKSRTFCNGCNDSGFDIASSTRNGRIPMRIMAFGDSNTPRPIGDNTRWTVLLENKDPALLVAFNEGYDGRTTKFDAGECNGLNIIKSKLTSHTPLDYVAVMLGTNDVKSKYGPPNAADIADGMRRILVLVDTHGGGAKTILITPPPLGDVTSDELSGAQSRIPPIAEEYRLLAMSRNLARGVYIR